MSRSPWSPPTTATSPASPIANPAPSASNAARPAANTTNDAPVTGATSRSPSPRSRLSTAVALTNTPGTVARSAVTNAAPPGVQRGPLRRSGGLMKRRDVSNRSSTSRPVPINTTLPANCLARNAVSAQANTSLKA
jgi:hypothetical protein